MANNPLTGLPVIGGMFDDSDERAMEILQQNRGLLDGVSLPEYENYIPEELQVSGEYNPENAIYQTISEDPRLRSSQLSVLDKLAGYADTGLSAEDEAAFARARNQAGQISRAGTQAALQNAQSRGVGGSGLEFAMREMASQGGVQAAQEAGLSQAQAAAKQRADYLSKYEDGLANMRGQDLTANKANSDIINQFNMANTNARNQSQQYNLGNRQEVMNQNVANRNDATKYRNTMAQQQFDNRMSKATGQMNANNGVAQGYYGQNAANTSERNANTQLGMMAIMGPKAIAAKKVAE